MFGVAELDLKALLVDVLRNHHVFGYVRDRVDDVGRGERLVLVAEDVTKRSLDFLRVYYKRHVVAQLVKEQQIVEVLLHLQEHLLFESHILCPLPGHKRMVNRLRRVQSIFWLIGQQSADQVEEALNVWVCVLINLVAEITCFNTLY